MVELATLGWACLGAAFPEVKRQFELRGQAAGEPLRYYVWGVLFIVGSGLIVTALPGPLPALTAVYAGCAAPLILSSGAQSLVKSLPTGKTTRAAEDGGGDAVDDIVGSTGPHVYVELDGKWFRQDGFLRFLNAL